MRKAKRTPVRRRWWLGALGAILALATVPIIQVALVRFFTPPMTPLMVLRSAEARWEKRPDPGRHYRWRALERIPPDFLKFVFIAEDQRFFQHRGFDWHEVELARKQAARTGKKPRGASTISMQCARSLFLWQGRSWVRKGLEVYYTFWMETLLSKRRILELYANVIEMGDGIYGIDAAARGHFGIDAGQLTREQCLVLAAILTNPREWNPRAPSAKLSARCAKILRQETRVSFPKSELR